MKAAPYQSANLTGNGKSRGTAFAAGGGFVDEAKYDST